jgi:hypothetical protein
MKTSIKLRNLTVLIAGMLFLGIALPASAADPITPIPWEGPTVLPDYVGAPAKAHPTANSGVPQNPLLAPNPSTVSTTIPGTATPTTSPACWVAIPPSFLRLWRKREMIPSHPSGSSYASLYSSTVTAE